MSPDDLLSGTSSYDIDYGTASARVSPAPSSLGERQLSLREAVEDPYIWESSRQGQQEAMEEQIERLRLRSRRLQVENSVRSHLNRAREARQAANEENDTYAEVCEDPSEESYATVAGVSAPTPPPFTVTAGSDEESDENDDLPSAAIMADRLRRESRWRPDSDDDGDELYRFPPPRRSYGLDGPDSDREGGLQTLQRMRELLQPLRAARLRTSSRIEAKDNPTGSPDLIAPHARFFIAKHKNKITINFHPAM